MELKIKLKNAYGKAEESIFFKTDDGLKLVFESDYVLDDLFVVFSDGATTKKHRLKKSHEIYVPDCFYKAGTLFVEVSMVARGEIAKTFIVEPITIKERDGELLAVKPYNEICRELEEEQKANKELKEKIVALKKEVDFIKAQVQEIWENEEK
ncbi:MAG: hypothetical protein IKA59_00850 [Clostridia bacterium]|nr:hypothetical protein [Clostridia bacterium]